MGRRADSQEKKALQKKITQEFIRAVELGGTEDGPKLIEQKIGIGDGSGNVWCAYRRGARSWPSLSLRQKIMSAVNQKYITQPMADKLLSKLPSTEVDIKTEKPVGEPYTFNATLMFFLDVKQTAELLEKQIQKLKDRIQYGHKELENAHYYSTALDLLNPVQILIQDMSLKKQAEELRLKTAFGKENYKDIAPSSAPKNASAYDVGYTLEWWMRSPPSAAEMEAMRLKVETGTEGQRDG